MEVSLATPLETRDGTLTKDAKLLNCYWEMNSIGQKVVVKRPGLTLLQNLGAGVGQGMVSQGIIDFALRGDTLYQILLAGIGPFALPSVTTANQRMTILNSNLLTSGNAQSIIKSISGAWVMSSVAVPPVKITNANYPATTVPGCVYLDGTYYVMTPSGEIYGSAIEDPLTWTALNFIATDRGLGKGIALARHLNYVVAFCERGIQFFYDAANPAPGSPLKPVDNATSTIGCEHADSIAEINGMTYFMTSDKSHGKSIAVIKGLSVSAISDPDVDRVLLVNPISPSDQNIYSMAFTSDGHSFYLLTFAGAGNLTLVLDITQGSWAQWSTAPDAVTDNAFGPGFFLKTHSGAPLAMLDRTTGVVSSFGRGATENVRFLVRTRGLDANTTSRKTLSELSLVADAVAATINVRYSNDDGQSWSAQRGIDMSTLRKRLTRLGSFIRRIFEFSNYSSAAIRLESMILPDRNLPAQTQPTPE